MNLLCGRGLYWNKTPARHKLLVFSYLYTAPSIDDAKLK